MEEFPLPQARNSTGKIRSPHPMADDYYKTLGLKRTASDDEIQKAYRQLARKYHPDMNPDDDTAKKKFQEVQAAFDVLHDEKKRAMYDRYGSNFESVGGGHGPRPSGGTHAWSGPGDGQQFEFDLGDLFGEHGPAVGGGGSFADLFKQFNRRGEAGRAAPQAQRGNDIEHEITVPFNTAVAGGEAAISVQRQTGKIDTINIKIPAGIEDGKKIRVRGQGEPGFNGAPAGDILITVRSSPHPYFQRRGRRLDVRVPITLAEAVEGAKIDVPTPRGTISVTVPAGTSSGKKLRIKGHGVAPNTGEPGDLFAEIQIVLPEQLSDEERGQLAAISANHPQNPRADLRW
jgi:DnaJ-class molecular chaperone